MIFQRILGYILINKDNVFKRFKGFRELVENQCNWPIKCLISNIREEYMRKDFNIYSSHHGISWKRSIPYTPNQKFGWNGMVLTLGQMYPHYIMGRGFLLLKLPSEYDFNQICMGYDFSWEIYLKETLDQASQNIWMYSMGPCSRY